MNYFMCRSCCCPAARDSYSFLHEQILLVHFVWFLSSDGWVAWLLHLGVSSTCCATLHMSKTMSLTIFDFCSFWLVGLKTHYLLPSCLWGSYSLYSFFPKELLSAVGFYNPWHQYKYVYRLVPQEHLGHYIWSLFSHWSVSSLLEW